MKPDVEERRQNPSDNEILVRLIQGIDAKLDETREEVSSFKAEFDELKPKLDEVVKLLERSKGVIWFIRGLVYIVSPLVAFAVWAKDHIKW